MATLDSIFVPVSSLDLSGTINAGTASAEIVIGKNQIFVINANQDLFIKVGVAGIGAPTTSNYRIANSIIAEYDTGSQNDRIRLFNNSASTATYWIQFLSRI